MKKVKCISLREAFTEQLELDREYWLDETTKCELAGEEYADFFRDKDKVEKVGRMLTAHFCDVISEPEIRNYTVNDIRRIAYQKYQFHWMISQGLSISDLSDVASDWWNERLAAPDCDDTLWTYLEEHGFEGSLWACYEEFLGAEYKDVSFMGALLNGYERELYLEDVLGAE